MVHIHIRKLLHSTRCNVTEENNLDLHSIWILSIYGLCGETDRRVITILMQIPLKFQRRFVKSKFIFEKKWSVLINQPNVHNLSLTHTVYKKCLPTTSEVLERQLPSHYDRKFYKTIISTERYCYLEELISTKVDTLVLTDASSVRKFSLASRTGK